MTANLKISALTNTVLPDDAWLFVLADPVTPTNYNFTWGALKSLVSSGATSWGSIGGTLSSQLDLQAALDAKVDKNAPIAGSTGTKITYDAKGLVTSSTSATTADIADSLNARYVTDAELAVIAVTNGVNTGDQSLAALALKATTISVVAPLSGGGDLSANRSITTSMNTGKLIGRSTAGVGVMEEVTLGTGFSFSGLTLNFTPSATTWGSITGTLSSQADLQTALNAKVDANGAIVAATNTKITYDTKGLVTAGTAATTADINDSLNRRYVTDAELVVIVNTSGINTGDQSLAALALKATTITAVAPLSGGGDLSANRTITTSMNTAKLIGRGTAGVGVMEEITLGTNLSFTGTTLNAAGGGAGGFTSTPVTVNVPTPTLETTVTVTDGTVTSTSRITLFQGMTTEADANDWSMLNITYRPIAGTGQFTITLAANDASYLFGDFKFQYIVG